jgi:RimJ/RimL family protein N-acetyltransferase
MSGPVGRPVPGWEPVPRPASRPLVGKWVTVSPMSVEAVPALWNAFSADTPDTWTYMSYGPFSGPDEIASLVEGWMGSTDPLFFTFDVDGVPHGWGAYLRIDPGMGSIEVGHLAFGPALRRTRAATEAMYLMAREAFDLGYRRYEWKCDALNTASRLAAERLGFTYEGTFRQHMVYKGRNRDTAWYSIVDTEWPRVRRAMEQWLEPSNFDEKGRQMVPLAALRGDG